ncbi:MAG: glycosyltransferase [Campylobacterales bacterium]|nr:glycosyltransferase [Campylobacterales bacterium]
MNAKERRSRIPKYNILFVHAAIGQFKELHRYLNESGLANAYTLCSPQILEKEKNNLNNLRIFTAVPQRAENLFFYVQKIDESTRRAFGVKNSVEVLNKDVPLDLIVCHGSGGPPLMLFDEVNIPIITYIEFPSFAAHGYDPKYEQPEALRYRDKLFEMYSFHQVIKSDHVITPSAYAKRMFPHYLQHKITPQMEGFRLKPTLSEVPIKKEPGITYIGYTARDLSSAKGFEQFVLIAKEILKSRQNVKFVIIGSPKVLYSYEGVVLDQVYGKGHEKTFKDYIFEREKIDTEFKAYFEFYDFMEYDRYDAYLRAIDFFIYPLQFGSANWGFYEIFCRGKIILGSDRCFIPEVISHEINGFICPYEDLGNWAQTAIKVIDHPQRYDYMRENIRIGAQKYMIENIAWEYLELFHKVILNRRHHKEEHYSFRCECKEEFEN